MSATTFDPARYKETTRQQWESAAEAWHRWEPTLKAWLGSATEVLLDLARVGPGSRVLDVASGAGEPAITAAKRVGPEGYVLATDIAANILEFAREAARRQGVGEIVETRVLDGEHLDLPEASFDAVLSRVGLIYFPDQQGALAGMRRVLKPGGRVGAIVYTTPERNRFFSIPVAIIRRRAHLPPPLPGQPGPFSLGGPGALEEAFRRAGFRDIETRIVPAPLRLPSAAECVRFERESFGALHQMLAGLLEEERRDVWDEIARELRQFEGPGGFEGPCELIVGVGVR
ncbi:MAG: methyltransferase domain-containing protein [Chloroflexota bacterium]|nr:methyltransferase domain-containing protein [Chloroflexota bacterium]